MIGNLRPYPAYKDSGVPWFGTVPEQWDVLRLKNSAANVVEQTDSREQSELYLALENVESWTGRIRVPNADVTFDSQVKRFRAYDVLFGKLRPYLAKVTRPSQSGVCVGEFLVLRPRKAQRLSTTYLEQVLRSKPVIDAINSSTFGAKMPRADWHFIGNMLVAIPSSAEQAAIVRFLNHIDRCTRRYILAKQKLIKLLEEQKQAIIYRSITLGLDPNVRLSPSGVAGLGDLPSHWEIRRLKYASGGVTVGVVVNPSSYFDDSGDVPMLLGNNILPGRLRLDDVRKISTSSNEHLSKSQLRPGDLAVVRVGAPGVAAVVPPELDNANCASVLIVRKGRHCKPRWLETIFNSPVVRRQVDIVKYGAAQKQFNVAHAVEFRVPVPPLAEQAEILEALDRDLSKIDPAIAAAEQAIRFLREYRIRLIADVVTGKLDVRQAAEQLPDETEEREELPLADDVLQDGEGAELASEELAEEEVIA